MNTIDSKLKRVVEFLSYTEIRLSFKVRGWYRPLMNLFDYTYAALLEGKHHGRK